MVRGNTHPGEQWKDSQEEWFLAWNRVLLDPSRHIQQLHWVQSTNRCHLRRKEPPIPWNGWPKQAETGISDIYLLEGLTVKHLLGCLVTKARLYRWEWLVIRHCLWIRMQVRGDDYTPRNPLRCPQPYRIFLQERHQSRSGLHEHRKWNVSQSRCLVPDWWDWNPTRQVPQLEEAAQVQLLRRQWHIILR